MKLPDVFAVQCIEDHWLVVAPAEHEFRARTYDRRELVVDSGEPANAAHVRYLKSPRVIRPGAQADVSAAPLPERRQT